MKSLKTITAEVKVMGLNSPTYTVEIREDNHDNTGDAIYSDNKQFECLKTAYNAFLVAVTKIATFESDAEFKTIELTISNNDNMVFEVLESKTYTLQYTEADFGKILITTKGEVVVKVEFIDKDTPYFASDESRFGVKFVLCDTIVKAVEFIMNFKPLMSKKQAYELLRDFIKF